MPKRTMEEKASNETNADIKRKNTFMLQEEYDNCTFRPTTQYPSSAITKPSITMPHGHSYPTNTHTRRNPSPHGKARYEGVYDCLTLLSALESAHCSLDILMQKTMQAHCEQLL